MNFLSPLLRGAGRPGLLIPVFFLLLSWKATAQELYRGTLPLCLGGVYTVLPGEPSPSANQASLGWTLEAAASLQHWRPFVIKDLGVSGLSTVFRLSPGWGGVAFNSFGIPGYHRSALWLAYGMMLGENCSAGIGFRSQLVSVPGELCYQWQLTVSGGVMLQINDKLMAGAHLTDPLYVPAFETTLTSLPSCMAIGLAYEPDPGLLLYLQTSYSSYRKTGLDLALSWQLDERLTIHSGFSYRDKMISAGLSIKMTNWSILLAVPWLPGCGLSPSLQLTRKL